ncbi:MAG TPA: ATP-binding protein [Terriglobia bacterium]|nr:ATP-binding protein [Terriglobia bacterium]
MGTRIRAYDWAKSPLGPVETWPQSLKTAVRIMLTSRQPIWLGWGDQLIKLYNDSYISIVGGKHPGALGQPASVVWREIWTQICPMLETAMGGIEGTYVEEQRLIMERNGYPEETFYTFSYSPIPNDEGEAGGIICVNTDDTQRVIEARQVRLLRELAARTADARTVEQACTLSTDCFSTNPYDIPLAMIYLTESQPRRVVLAGNPWGLERGHPAAPEVAALDNASVWPFSKVIQTNRPCHVSNLGALRGTLPAGPQDPPPHQAVALPIAAQGREGEVGILVVGLNPYRLFDATYQGFLALVAAQIASAIANARAYEEERRRAEALAEIDRAKTTFFSNISHEFRTPLTLMLAPLEHTLEVHSELSTSVREQITLAQRNGVRLLKLVNTLLDFSRIEAGRTDATYEPVDLAAFTADLASVFRSAVEKAGLKYIVNCDDLAQAVYVDREMYEKVVLNLISNAFKFTLEGEIEVRLRAVDARVQLSVRDTGTGIPDTELPHVFERFHRVKGARGRSIEGSGIGLALVQELVRLHRGEVTLTSAPDKGSTFVVTLPLGSAHLPADRIAPSTSTRSRVPVAKAYVEEAMSWLPSGVDTPDFEAGGNFARSMQSPQNAQTPGARILLADDNTDMRDYLQRLLLECGYQVVCVPDGERALALARSEQFDLVLSDIMMPRVDGFELLKALRSDPQTTTLPVILLSARAGEESRVEGLAAGADDYLVKPFSARELAARVESHIKLAALRRDQESRTAADLAAMERLNDVGNRCARMGHDFDGCLEAILAAALAVTGAEKGNIQLYDFASKTLRIAAHSGFDEPFLRFFETVSPEESTACAAAFRSSERIIVEDLEKSEVFGDARCLSQLLEAGVRSVQSTPLISSSGEIFGAISTHFRRAHRPSERDLRLVDLLARQAADYLERRQSEQEKEKLYQQEQRAREAAESATRAKDEFLAVVSHELRSPLNAILGHAHLLRSARRDDTDIRRITEVIERNGRAQIQLIEDLLDTARIISGKLKLDVRKCDLRSVVTSAIDSMLPAAASKNIQLDFVCDGDQFEIAGDADRLQQVVWNLLSNAVKFTNPGGRVSIGLRREVSAVRIVVTDTGTGISGDLLPFIFDRFRQGDSSASRRFSGLGLGLSLVKQLTELHGGTVSVTSPGEGLGAAFTVMLPVRPVPRKESGPRNSDHILPTLQDGSARYRLDGLHILVVDNDETARDVVFLKLQEYGALPATVSSTATAIEALESRLRSTDDAGPFDVLLSDISLPGGDGYDLMRRVRTHPDGRINTIRAIALTADARFEDRLRALEAGYQTHIAKPVEDSELNTVIAALAGKI